MIVAMIATSRVLHESIAEGMIGLMFPFYALPVLSLAFVLWAVASRRLADRPRRAAMVAIILLVCGGWTLVRFNGMTGGGSAEFAWRWAETSEERLLARAPDEPVALPSAPATAETPEEQPFAQAGDELEALPSPPATAEAAADWPGFRGPNRNGVIPGVRIETDWSQSPPVELWRRPVGPGWSSFAVRGDLLYTQEQRGDNEVVACYNATTGEPVWRHRDAARFWESMGGAGPRGTPTISNDRVYTFGATGILNVLSTPVTGPSCGRATWRRTPT